MDKAKNNGTMFTEWLRINTESIDVEKQLILTSLTNGFVTIRIRNGLKENVW